MIVALHPKFKKAYKRRIQHIPSLIEKVADRIDLFRQNPADPILHDHALTGSKESFRAFSITGDIRIVYERRMNEVTFYDIGTHNQVY